MSSFRLESATPFEAKSSNFTPRSRTSVDGDKTSTAKSGTGNFIVSGERLANLSGPKKTDPVADVRIPIPLARSRSLAEVAANGGVVQLVFLPTTYASIKLDSLARWKSALAVESLSRRIQRK